MRISRGFICLFIATTAFATESSGRTAGTWREAFGSSPASYEAPSDAMLQAAARFMKSSPEAVKASLSPQPLSGTVRYRIVLTGAGSSLRIRLSNEEGTAPLSLAGASVGVAGDGFNARAGSIRRLTFGGVPAITVPAGAPVVSDPVDLPVSAGTELVVSASLASPLMNEKRGGASFILAPGDQTGREALDSGNQMTGRPLVSGVSVLAPRAPHVVVTLGDSITDGNRPALGQLHGWPEELARRLNAAHPGGYTVVNAGISGNRLLAPGWGAAALARLDRDALRIEGISHLVLLEGTNDIGMSGKGPLGDNPEITAEDLIAGYRQVIARARARGIKVIIGTLTPAEGSNSHSSPRKDAIHEKVNAWIRSSGEPDGVIDFDHMMGDPASPGRFSKSFDSGDHLHPNESGYKAMGDGIDLGLFH